MAIFDDSIGYVLAHEGGYTDHPADPGGMTQWGISLRFLRATETDIDGDGDIDGEDIRALTIEGAKKLYRSEFWDKLDLRHIYSQAVATKILDVSVNTGRHRGTKITQEALGKAGRKVRVDGKLGPLTLAAINEADPAELLGEIRKRQAAFYRRLVKARPNLSVFLKGWLTRAGA